MTYDEIFLNVLEGKRYAVIYYPYQDDEPEVVKWITYEETKARSGYSAYLFIWKNDMWNWALWSNGMAYDGTVCNIKIVLRGLKLLNNDES